MGPLAKKIDRKYTYEDYKGWPNEERWEIIAGEAYCMTPAPTVKHQLLLFNLSGLFRDLFRGKPCQPFFAPTDVVLDDTNIVQPDLFLVCDKEKITDANIQGTPDLVVEVPSPSTKLKDRREKKRLYERFGVKEYLVVHPEDEMVDRYRLVNGRYEAEDVFSWDETMALSAFPGLELRLCEVFGRELPAEEEAAEPRIRD